MPFVKYEDGLFTKNDSRKTLYVPMICSLVVCVLVMIINLVCFPKKEIGHSWMENSGWAMDTVQWLILNFILWSFNRLTVKASLRRWINLGLFIWIMSAAFDVMDEFIHQPMWVGYYVEDVSRLAGMLCVSMGIYFIVRYVNDKYADVSIDSYRDELTHLPNRRYFKNVLLELNNANNYVFIIDIDFFKNINDKYGHDVGDEVLREFGNLLSRLYDGNVTASRIGGEEFAVILQLSSKQDASVVAEKILSRTRDLIIRGEIRFTVSIGAGHKKEDETVEDLLKRVDIALYDAKCRGKNRIEWADG
ncbi:GGDEF domain-containing protein [Rahnella selenatireducens]|uniref:GGDEF domain-containing protein n=1 Tax=Rahnella selenatireducens TaxID=3389797 RepID=UPI0039689DF4